MKCLNINMKNVAAGVALVTFGATTDLSAQVRTQTQTQTGTETRMLERDQDRTDYDEIFSDISDTERHSALDLLRQDENFSTFLQLLESSGLERSLAMQDEVTIFAPTNQAFAQMRKEEYDRLKDPANRGDLMRIINAHVVPRKIFANEFQGNQVLSNPDGEDIAVETAGQAGSGALPNTIIIGGATIIRHDIETQDGVIHIVNRIVRPDGFQTAFY